MSKLVLVLLRHGHAGDAEVYARLRRGPDSSRPLTAKGRADLKVVVRSLASFVKSTDLLVSSPYVRAKQTAEFVNLRMKNIDLEIWPELKPEERPELLLQKIKKRKARGVCVFVGHEPHLSRLLSFILTGDIQTNFHIKKGGFAIVEFDGGLTTQHARLKCLLQPSQIKKISKISS
jgi:phosphohistidine phosphatase